MTLASLTLLSGLVAAALVPHAALRGHLIAPALRAEPPRCVVERGGPRSRGGGRGGRGAAVAARPRPRAPRGRRREADRRPATRRRALADAARAAAAAAQGARRRDAKAGGERHRSAERAAARGGRAGAARARRDRPRGDGVGEDALLRAAPRRRARRRQHKPAGDRRRADPRALVANRQGSEHAPPRLRRRAARSDGDAAGAPGAPPERLPSAPVVVGPPAMLLRLLGEKGEKKLQRATVGGVRTIVVDEADALLRPLSKYATHEQKERRESHPKEAATLLKLLCEARGAGAQVLAASATVGRPLRREIANLAARPFELIRAPDADAPPPADGADGPPPLPRRRRRGRSGGGGRWARGRPAVDARPPGRHHRRRRLSPRGAHRPRDGEALAPARVRPGGARRLRRGQTPPRQRPPRRPRSHQRSR